MARDITVTFDDGSTHVYKGAPDNVTPDAVQARAEQEFGKSVSGLDGGRKSSVMSEVASAIKNGVGNLAAGAIRGAGSIGATILAPVDIASDALAGKGLTLESNRQRRADMDFGLKELGANPESFAYQAGKLGGEIAGTAGVGEALAGARVLANAPRLAQAIRTAGFQTGAPAATTVAGKAADLGIRTAGGAMTGAVSAGLVNPEDASTGAIIGGALPGAAKAVGAAGRAIGRTIAGNPVSAEVSALAERAKQLGIDIPADRLVNSKPLNAVAAGLNYVPFSGRAATEAKMQSQLNRALSRTFGQDSDNVTMALRQAQGELGTKFDDVLSSNAVKIDTQFLDDLAQHAQRASGELGTDGAKIIGKQVDEIIAKSKNGLIDGQAAYNIKKTLDRIGNRNTPEAYYARDLKKSLMEALNRSLGTNEAKAFAKTRQEYGNMLALENLAQNGVDGNVSIARIANMKNINNPDLQELADISAQFLKAREGQHGAAQRAAAGIGVGSFAGLPVLAGSIAAGRATNAALNSNALRNMVIGNPAIGPNNRLLQAITNPALQGAIYRAAPVVGSQ